MDKISYQEALKIPDLHFSPPGLAEDCFYLKLAERGELSQEEVKEIRTRVEQRKTKDESYYWLCRGLASIMISNLDTYGHPCIAWWPKD